MSVEPYDSLFHPNCFNNSSEVYSEIFSQDRPPICPNLPPLHIRFDGSYFFANVKAMFDPSEITLQKFAELLQVKTDFLYYIFVTSRGTPFAKTITILVANRTAYSLGNGFAPFQAAHQDNFYDPTNLIWNLPYRMGFVKYGGNVLNLRYLPYYKPINRRIPVTLAWQKVIGSLPAKFLVPPPEQLHPTGLVHFLKLNPFYPVHYAPPVSPLDTSVSSLDLERRFNLPVYPFKILVEALPSSPMYAMYIKSNKRPAENADEPEQKRQRKNTFKDAAALLISLKKDA